MQSGHTHASLLTKLGAQDCSGKIKIWFYPDNPRYIQPAVVPGLQQAAADKFDDIVLPKQADMVSQEG